MRFEFATAAQILFGPGALRRRAEQAAGTGRKALVVTGGHPVPRQADCWSCLQAGGEAP